MSHGIETDKNGEGKAFYARKPAWHELGYVSRKPQPVAKALKLAKLSGWDVHKEPVYAHVVVDTPEGAKTLHIPVAGQHATVRTNPDAPEGYDALGVVGNWFEPVQIEETTEILETVRVKYDAEGVETAASLDGGQRYFVTMKLPDQLKIAGVPALDVYLAILGGFDGSTPTRIMTTPVQIVCANTERAALRGPQGFMVTGDFIIRNTSSARARLDAAKRAMVESSSFLEAFAQAAERMAATKITTDKFVEIATSNRIHELFGVAPGYITEDHPKYTTRVGNSQRDRLATLVDMTFGDRPETLAPGTAWAAYNSVTEWADHVYDVRGLPKAADGSDLEGEALLKTKAQMRAQRTLNAEWLTKQKRTAFAEFAAL